MGRMYFTMLPLIFAGVTNMIFVKTNFYKKNRKPIDCGKMLRDNRRVFGDNKTWIGFMSMTIFTIIFQYLFGVLCNCFQLNSFCDFYLIHGNTAIYNIIVGFWLGFFYVLCELPNSFIKRRLNIDAGKHGSGFVGVLFLIIDQVDSMFGVMFIVCVFSGLGIVQYLSYVTVGALTHIFVNFILCALGVRKKI